MISGQFQIILCSNLACSAAKIREDGPCYIESRFNPVIIKQDNDY